VFVGLFAGVAGENALGDFLEHGAQLIGHVGEPCGIGVGIGVEVIQAAGLHDVIAMRIGQRVIGLAEMPFAGEVGFVAAGFELGGEGPFGLGQSPALPLERDGCHAAAIGESASLHGGSTGGAAWLG